MTPFQLICINIKLRVYFTTYSRNTFVWRVTSPHDGKSTISFAFQVGTWDSSRRRNVQTSFGTHQDSPIQGELVAFWQELKWPGSEHDSSCQSRMQVMSEWSHRSSNKICLHGVNRCNLILHFVGKCLNWIIFSWSKGGRTGAVLCYHNQNHSGVPPLCYCFDWADRYLDVK